MNHASGFAKPRLGVLLSLLLASALVASGCTSSQGTNDDLDEGDGAEDQSSLEDWAQCPLDPAAEPSDCGMELRPVEAETTIPPEQKCINEITAGGEDANYSIYAYRDEQTNGFSYLTKIGFPITHLIGVASPSVDDRPIEPHSWFVQGSQTLTKVPDAVWWENNHIGFSSLHMVTLNFETDIELLQGGDTTIIYEKTGNGTHDFNIYLGIQLPSKTYWFGGNPATHHLGMAEGNVTLQIFSKGFVGSGHYIGPPRMIPGGPNAPEGTEESFEEPNC